MYRQHWQLWLPLNGLPTIPIDFATENPFFLLRGRQKSKITRQAAVLTAPPPPLLVLVVAKGVILVEQVQ